MSNIDDAITLWAPKLHVPTAINPVALLRAICHVETNDGARAMATLHEPAYCYSGRYYNASEALRRASRLYGCLAHSSFGPWQIMYITACEVGYSGDPVPLRHAAISAEFVIAVLNRRVFDKLTDPTPTDAFDAWNSGSARAGLFPKEYVDKATADYLSRIERLVT